MARKVINKGIQSAAWGGREGIEITGLKEVQDILSNFGKREGRNLNRATIHAIAGEIRNSAKKRAPKGKSGTLRKAIKAVRRKPRHPDNPFSDVRVEHGPDAKHDAWYWHFIEYGTVKNEATPFILPAIAEVRPHIVSLYKKHFTKKFEQSLKRRLKKARGRL